MRVEVMNLEHKIYFETYVKNLLDSAFHESSKQHQVSYYVLPDPVERKETENSYVAYVLSLELKNLLHNWLNAQPSFNILNFIGL